ncbi:MAG TPA: hypothetical protein VN285_10985 [Candidatus Deferrimicrobium sp.]|nr:hypothetical protein [Candidatus Deferrimicrobium sp.]
MDEDIYRKKLAFVIVFAMAAAFVEAAVVVYLRALYYPEGFGFPLKLVPMDIFLVEVVREVATVGMLLAVAALAGKRRWERFGYFLILFGVWDILYYVCLKAAINWPSSLLDWDILFLVPLPWIGPVIAPVTVAVVMIAIGLLITRRFARGHGFRPTGLAWFASGVGTFVLLYSFMRDTDATLRFQMPQPYQYVLLGTGVSLYAIAFIESYAKSRRDG